MKAPSVIIPAFPYEGPLLWLLAPTYHLLASPEDLARDEYTGGSGYYEALYGPNAGRLKHRAASLAIVFDRLEFASIDIDLPDSGTFTSGGNYYHPDLGLSMSWNWPGWPDPREDYEFLKKAVLNNHVIQDLFRSDPLLPNHPDHQLSFVYRLLVQLRVATTRDGILLGNATSDKFFVRLSEILVERGMSETSPTPKVWTMSPTTVDVMGLDLTIPDVDSFAVLRSHDTIRSYASGFRKALEESQRGIEPSRELLRLMREARDSSLLAGRIRGAFEVTGSIANLIGLIPVLGTIATAAGFATATGAKVAERSYNAKRWYLLGSKMREIALEAHLDA